MPFIFSQKFLPTVKLMFKYRKMCLMKFISALSVCFLEHLELVGRPHRTVVNQSALMVYHTATTQLQCIFVVKTDCFCVFDSEFDKNPIKRSKRRVSRAGFILWQQFMVPRFRNHQKSGCVSSGCNFLICTRDLQFRIFITWCVYGCV